MVRTILQFYLAGNHNEHQHQFQIVILESYSNDSSDSPDQPRIRVIGASEMVYKL